MLEASQPHTSQPAATLQDTPIQTSNLDDHAIQNGTKQDANDATKFLFHKVVEPSLGTVDRLSVRRESSSTNRVPSPNRLYGQLTALRSRPKTQSIYSGYTGQTDYVQEDIFAVQHRSSSPVSYNSTSRMKQLPLPSHTHTTTPFPRVGSAKGVRSVPLCAERYLGTDIKSKPHLRSKSTEYIQNLRSCTDQVKRFDNERRALYKSRTIKRVTEMYSHRLDQGYFMSGSGLGLADKYHVDEAELERLREFSRSKMIYRAGSASSVRLRSRPSLTTPTSGFFVTQKDLANSDITSDMVISGRQFSSKAPSEAGKTIQTRASSATSIRTHRTGGRMGTDGGGGMGENDETTGNEGTADGGDEKQKAEGVEGNEQDGTNGCVSNSSATNKDSINMGNEDGSNNIVNRNKDLNSDNSASNPDQDKTPDTNEGGDNSKGDDANDMDGGADQHGDANNHGDVGNHGDTGNHGDNTADVKDGVKEDGQDRKNGKEGRTGSGGGSGRGGENGGGDASGALGNGDGGVKDDSDGDKQNGKDNTDGENGDGMSSPTNEEEVLQISLTAGISLISKPTIIRNKHQVFMTNFDKPGSIDGLRNEMESIQKSQDEEDEDSDDDNDNSGLEDDPKRYQLNTKDSEITRMEEKLKKVELLEADMASVGHLAESKEDLKELQKEEEAAERLADNVASGEYDTGIYAQTKNDEELKKADERRKDKQEQQRYRSPYKPTVNSEGNTKNKNETNQPYRFQLSDIYKFINSRQKAIFEEKFEELDTYGNGKITLKEVKKKLKASKAPKEQVTKFMQVFDLNKDKTIDKREFVTVAVLNDKLTGRETQSVNESLRLDLDSLSYNIQAYKEMFQVTDKNGDGRLNLEEIMLIVALSVGVDIGSDPEVVKHVHRTIDADNDGSIDFIEFLSYIPFFLKLHQQILGRPASIGEIEEARLAVRKAVLKADV